MLNTIQKTQLKKEVDETWKLTNRDRTPSECLVEMLVDFMTDDDFKCYGPLYKHATEDMRTYYQAFDKVDSFLTIGASGDQLLNAVSMGAKRIDVFDKNCLSKRGCALKVAASRTISKEELLNFFMHYRFNMYKKMRGKLSEEDLAYWNSVYDILSEDEVRTDLFSYRNLGREIICGINPYLDDDKYELLKEQLKDVEINYIDSQLENLEEHIKGRKYDAITLSNVYEYLNFAENTLKENAQNFHDYVMEHIYPCLNEGGKMMVAYMYAYNDEVKKFVEEQAIKNPHGAVTGKSIDISRVSDYLDGFTTQNLAYGYLLDTFAGDNIEKVPTNNIVYGQSFDKSHDLALMVKR